MVVGLLFVLWFGLQQKEIAGSKVVNVPFSNAPDFSLGLFDGSTFTLSDALKTGKPVVVNFWASWCGPCADEAPLLQDAARRNADRFTFVGVNVQDHRRRCAGLHEQIRHHLSEWLGERRARSPSSMGCAVCPKRTSLRLMGAWCANGTP